MLKEISLHNFKSWRAIEHMRFGSITGLFGTNSSGKSSILQFLLMLKQTAESPDRKLVLDLGNDASSVSLGTFGDIVTDHGIEHQLSFSIDWSLPEPLEVKDPDKPKAKLFQARNMGFSATIASASRAGKLTVPLMQYSLGHACFSLTKKNNSAEYTLGTSGTDFRFKRALGRKWPLPPPVKFYGFADEIRTYHQNAAFLGFLELEFERMLRSIYYLGPLRDFPKREYVWGGGDPADMGRRGENAIAAILSSTKRGEKISRGKGRPRLSLEEYVAYWLKELGLIHDFRVAEIAKGTNLYRVHVTRTEQSPEVLITDVGFGVSQVLPVLVLCYYAPVGSTILFEQPEIHLHPKVQSGLADVFIDAMNVRDIQLVIESHSEHFLRRLQRRIAEGQLIEDSDAALYFCDTDEGGSSLTELDLDMYGNIRNWPSDFFGDEVEDMEAMSRAARERRRNAGE